MTLSVRGCLVLWGIKLFRDLPPIRQAQLLSPLESHRRPPPWKCLESLWFIWSCPARPDKWPGEALEQNHYCEYLSTPDKGFKLYRLSIVDELMKVEE